MNFWVDLLTEVMEKLFPFCKVNTSKGEKLSTFHFNFAYEHKFCIRECDFITIVPVFIRSYCKCTVVYLFTVEPDCGGRVNVLLKLESVEHCGFTGFIESQHCTMIIQHSWKILGQAAQSFLGHLPAHDFE